MKPIRFAFLAVAFAGIGGAHATPRTAEPRPPVLAPAPQALLDAHNRLRRAEGVPPLRWSPALAAGAQQWAERLAGSGGFEHSHAPGLGENLAALSPPGRYPMQSFLDLWIDERRVFTSGRFPQVSTTGDWTDVGHYTQMIWRTTTQVGCGLADSAAQSILVCRYAPAGNVIGETVY